MKRFLNYLSNRVIDIKLFFLFLILYFMEMVDNLMFMATKKRKNKWYDN